jgi:NAD(P)H-dependent FMN reductase
MSLIKVIVGSVRPGRFGNQPAAWIMDLSKDYPEATFELIDLAEVKLPFLDEATPPSLANGNYEHEHTAAWSKLIGEADGYIFVTGEYNHGIPASLKNAIDFVANEWYYKPVSFVSYGAHGGGVRAVEHLRGVVAWLRMYAMHDEVAIKDYWGQLDDKGTFQPTDEQNADAKRLLTNLIFWSDKLAPIRKELQAKNG